jgi:hypothetical protein
MTVSQCLLLNRVAQPSPVNITENTGVLEIYVDTVAGGAAFAVDVGTGVTVGTLRIVDTPGGFAASSVSITGAGTIATTINPSGVTVTTGGGATHTLTAVVIGANDTGKTNLVGSISPTTYSGATIRTLQAFYFYDPEFPLWTLYFDLASTGLAQNYFTTLVVNEQVFLSSEAALFDNSGAYTRWQWEGTDDNNILPGAGTYSVSIT